jgi:hypothetical protein
LVSYRGILYAKNCGGAIMEQEQLTFPEHPSSPPVFNGVCVTRSLVLCVCYE